MSVPSRILLTALVTLLLACGPRLPDEDRIRNALQRMTQALVDREASTVLEPLAEDFVGETWDLDRRALRLLLRREMLAHDRLRARLFDIEVDLLSPERASASSDNFLRTCHTSFTVTLVVTSSLGSSAGQ